MGAVVGRCVAAGSALTLAGVVAVAALPQHAPKPRIVSMPTRLVDAEDSIMNIPINLFYDLLNVPANELDAIQELGNALSYGGPWLDPSATNLWGIDVADPPKAEALINLWLPFPALSDSLGQQIAGVYEAELPTSPDCSTFFCLGVFQLADSWGKVPLSELLSGYYFDPSAPGSVDPLGSVAGEFGFPGTIDGDLYPWAGTTFTLQPLEPFTNFWDSLIAPPSADPIEPLPNVAQAFASLLEGIYTAVNPFASGADVDPSAALQLADLDPSAAADLSAESSNLVSGLDFADLAHLGGGLGTELSTMLPEHLASLLAGAF
jgi:hypothetical protein